MYKFARQEVTYKKWWRWSH